jgi:hypothetical protein
MSMEIRFSLTPRLVAVGSVTLLALFVLLFLLGLQVGQRMRPAGAAHAVSGAMEDARKQAADAEAAAKQKLQAVSLVPGAPAAAPAAAPAPAAVPAAAKP